MPKLWQNFDAGFCATNDFASVGAIRFLDELTMEIQGERIPQ